MMKKILSLCLAVVMVLGIFAMGASAETTGAQWKEYKLLLDEGVAVKFVFDGLTEGDERTIRLSCDLGTKEFNVTADANGEISATWDQLNPALFDMGITATVVEDEVSTPNAKSVLGYCQGILTDAKYSDDVYALVVDLLNYTDAVNQWKADPNGDSTTKFVGRELTDAELAALAKMTLVSKGYSLTESSSALTQAFAKIGFTYSGNVSLAKWYSTYGDATNGIKDRADIAAENLLTYDMIVSDSWNGDFVSNEEAKNVLTVDDIKPGDFLVIDTNDAAYWVAFYTGDNVLLWHSTKNAYRGSMSLDAFVSDFLNGLSFDYTRTGASETTTVAHNGNDYYCILRVSQVLPNFETVVSPEVGDLDFFGTQAIPGALTQIVTPDQSTSTVTFGGAMPILGESIGYRFYVSGDLTGASFKGKLGDGEPVDLTLKTNNNGSYVDFTDLTPADLYETVTVYAVDAEEALISIEKQFSGASYSAWVMAGDDSGRSGKLKSLVSAMMVYANGAKNYVDNGYIDYMSNQTKRPMTSGAFTEKELYRFSILGGFWPSANNLPDSLVNTYAKVGIDISDIDDNWTSGKKTLHWVYNYAVAKLIDDDETTAPNAGYENVETMLVDGSHLATHTVADYQVGDAFLAKGAAGGYWTIILLNKDESGAGQFLAVTSSKRSYLLKLNADQSLAYVTLTAYFDGDSATDINVFKGDAQFTYDASTTDQWTYFYCLRPSQLINAE